MAAELIAGLGAVKTAFDIAKGLKDIDDATRRNAAVIELQEKILSAQQAQTALIERISSLEKVVASHETWDAQKSRYQLQKLPPGTFLYTLKEGMEQGDPPHHICPKCYEHRKRSLLHSSGPEAGVEIFQCFECQTNFHVGKYNSWERTDGITAHSPRAFPFGAASSPSSYFHPPSFPRAAWVSCARERPLGA